MNSPLRFFILLLLSGLIVFPSCSSNEQGNSGEPKYSHPKDEILILPGEDAFPDSLFVKAVHVDDLTGILDLYRSSEASIKEGYSNDYADLTGDGSVDTIVHHVYMKGDSLRYSFELRTERGSLMASKASYPSAALSDLHWQGHKVYSQVYPWSAYYYLPEVKARTAVPDTTPPFIRRYTGSMKQQTAADSLPEVAAERAVSRFLSYMQTFRGRHVVYWEANQQKEMVWYAPEQRFISLIPAK